MKKNSVQKFQQFTNWGAVVSADKKIDVKNLLKWDLFFEETKEENRLLVSYACNLINETELQEVEKLISERPLYRQRVKFIVKDMKARNVKTIEDYLSFTNESLRITNEKSYKLITGEHYKTNPQSNSFDI